MKILLFKRAEYISEILRFGKREATYFESPSDLFLAGAFLQKAGYEVDCINLFAGDKEIDYSKYDLVVGWIPLFDGLYVGLEDLKNAKNTGAATAVVLNDCYDGTEITIMKEYPAVDYIVRLEERELALKELCDNIKMKSSMPANGIMYRKGEEIIDTGIRKAEPTLDHLVSFASFLEEEDLSRYTEFFIRTGRGCPYPCKYCHERKKKNRKRNMDDVISELKLLPGGSDVHFGDPILFGDVDYVHELASRMLEEKINIKWHGEGRVDQLLDKGIDFKLLGKSGLFKLDIGVESFDERVMKATNKGISIKQVHDTIELCKSHNIVPYLNMMIGHPADSNESLQRTLDEITKLPLNAIVGVQRLRPIGEYLHEMINLGLLEKPLTIHEYAEIINWQGSPTQHLSIDEVTEWGKRINNVVAWRNAKMKIKTHGVSYLAKKIIAKNGINKVIDMVPKHWNDLKVLFR